MPFGQILEPPCTISPYQATFEVEPRAHHRYDVRVTLELTYRVLDAPKSEGFKFVGELPVTDISVTDEQGHPLRWRKDAMRETRIRWSFPPVSNGDMKVVVRFRIPDALSGDARASYFSAPWLKNFRIRVTD